MSTRIASRHRGTIGAAALMIIATGQPAWAQNEDSAWRLRFDFAWVDPSGEIVTRNVGGAVIGSSFDTGFGAGLRAEYQLSTRLGVEFGVLSAGSVDVTTAVSFGSTTRSAVDISSFTPLTVGLNFHLTPGAPVDVYLGPQLAFIEYSDVGTRTTFGTATNIVSVDNDVGWGALIGLDIPLGDNGWSVQANLRYITTDIRNSGGTFSVSSDFDPVIFSLGFGYRF